MRREATVSEIGETTTPHIHSDSHLRTLPAIERAVLYTGVFLAPYATLRFSELFFTLSDFFFCLSLSILFITGRIWSKPLGEATPLWLIAFTLLFVGLMIGSILHNSPERGLIVTAQYLFAYVILMFILIRDEPKVAYRLAAIFLVSMVLIDIHGIITFYAIGYVPGEGKGGRYRGTAFGHAPSKPELGCGDECLDAANSALFVGDRPDQVICRFTGDNGIYRYGNTYKLEQRPLRNIDLLDCFYCVPFYA
ncbi:hypothetical protein ABIA15_004621 [Sinorhizobium fredii]